MTEAFKVVVVNSEKQMVSTFSWMGRLVYKLNEKTTPKVGCIFVFKTKEDAMEHFGDSSFNFLVLRGNAERLRKGDYMIAPWAIDTLPIDSIERKWRIIKHGIMTVKQAISHDIDLSPRKTYYCNSFTPLEIVVKESYPWNRT